MTRALILGGGGVTGIAWEAGVLQGLADQGIDIANWDMVVGTSAGAIVGTKLLGEPDFAAWFVTQLRDDTADEDEIVIALAGRVGSRFLFAGRRPRFAWLPRLWLTLMTAETFVRHAARGKRALRRGMRRSSGDAPGPRVVVGPSPMLAQAAALGLVARTAPEERFIDVIANTLDPVVDWPKGLVVTAIALDGSTVAFDEAAGVELVRAVAASTAVPLLFPPIVVAGRPYVDGGIGSQTHADVAAGMDDILVVAPINTGALESELAGLRASARRVDVVRPSPAAVAALGRNIALLDPARRAAAAREGHEDGRRAAEGLVTRADAERQSSSAA
jgi:NTE family protein